MTVEGRPLSELTRAGLAQLRRRSIGYVFQDLDLIPALTAVEDVSLPLELDGRRGREAGRLAPAALEEVAVR